ncbi:methylated-DNA--[protein]-cysteine S-methyltransferase [Corynebacterium uberis]|uniref:methylated-DNA--[protein]-cysteine S-methyltransferase n=1 Tax=Corynebacterium TaxID=1716 RepID=UPI001D0B5D98|nr:methylated-DNA--[protein]-cysteine S-methyltransferase [Corynebacterium uberis]MCZ9309967.1 methylated-DNA--[protein]-cysteine S-methyltransferase [Corynebacterium sp. c6VSa_13]UDL73114.1 methylated-DNA--[protein]-cysteine S-methyltransferase [Corynebacterium uberis]UDL76009.1 methylated-DNA--[protein]-cysteine S-methyltransferase [Corynebacterium uberis]UDL78221.1 methylated-DNA--[protein]-cysteine S-methyltransferase [Corynebacterium uberis]UDL80504.1 methylated-DNA--[protein]-cysteine S-
MRRVVDSPLGALTLVAEAGRLTRVLFGDRGAGESADSPVLDQVLEQVLDQAATQLAEYFAGQRRTFDLPLALPSGEDFRARAQRGLLEIPWGQTVSYGQLAALVGSPRAARAVGTACRTNPLPVVVPCHRVVHADGSLGNYAGGAWMKRVLLELEGLPGAKAAGVAPRGHA